jgi:hypothetical protein
MNHDANYREVDRAFNLQNGTANCVLELESNEAVPQGCRTEEMFRFPKAVGTAGVPSNRSVQHLTLHIFGSRPQRRHRPVGMERPPRAAQSQPFRGHGLLVMPGPRGSICPKTSLAESVNALEPKNNHQFKGSD